MTPIGARRGATAVIFAGCVMGTMTARAGVLDSPLPGLQSGQTTQHVFTVPGVIKNNNLETIFICTSLDSAAIAIGVEVFGADGGVPLNDYGMSASDGVLTGVLPGQTRTITTGATIGFHEDEVILLAAASLRNGSARILSTSKKIACNAFVADELSDPPISMVALKIIGKKQRGE